MLAVGGCRAVAKSCMADRDTPITLMSSWTCVVGALAPGSVRILVANVVVKQPIPLATHVHKTLIAGS